MNSKLATAPETRPKAAEPAPRPKAYSYVRFSTPEQAKGDSFRRQNEQALAYAQEHDLDLDTDITFHDLGVSAFKGKNAETGALRAFLDAVENDHIQEGSYLLVESLDRISRGAITKAHGIFMLIISSGITLVTLGDRRVYSKAQIDANPTDLFISLVVMMRGNDESSTKARRLKAVWAMKREKASREGKLFTKLVPGWVRVTPEGTLESIPEREAITQRIFTQFLQGVGKEGIAKGLNAEGVETWGMATRKPGAHWRASYVSKILSNPAVLGTLTTRTVETEKGKEVTREAQRIEGYYPRVIDDETFARVQALRDTEGVTRQKGRATTRNILAGLSLCPSCGGSMIRVNKGSGAKGGAPYLVCSKAKAGAGCAYKAVRLDHVETALRQSYAELSKGLLAEGSEGLSGEVDQLELDHLELTEMVGRAAHALAKEASPALTRKLRELETELEETTKELTTKRAQLFNQTHAMRRARITELQPLLESGEVNQANPILRELLRSVTINHETGYLDCLTKGNTRIEIMYHWMP